MSPVDVGTAVRFGIGLVAGLAGIDASVALLAAVGYSALVEVSQSGRGALTKRRSGESYANQAVDIVSMLAGLYAGRYAARQRTPQLGFSGAVPPSIEFAGGRASSKAGPAVMRMQGPRIGAVGQRAQPI